MTSSNLAANGSEREFDFSDSEFNFIRNKVREMTGIELAAHKKHMVYGRLVRRIRVLNMSSIGEYCNYLVSNVGKEEIVNFVNAVTTNLTKFFREEHHFEHLKSNVLKETVSNPPANKRFRIWSAGCSMGMEAYSAAMTSADSIKDISRWDFKILATDIDTNVLQKGTDGIYSEEDFLSVPEIYRKNYINDEISQSGEKVKRITSTLRDLVAFKYLNLIEEWPMKGQFDVIFCRNVVIYFSKDTQRVIFAKMAELLKPNGWLYIGHSETMNGVCDRFELRGKTIYQKVK